MSDQFWSLHRPRSMADRVRPTLSPVMMTLFCGTIVKRISFMKPNTSETPTLTCSMALT